jgi:hypothetical protein
MEIGTASGTLRTQLANVAATEQAILIQHNTTAPAIAHGTVKLFFEYRDRHGYDEREAAGYAFADVAEGIAAAYEVAWGATSDSVEHADVGGGHHARAAAVAGGRPPGRPLPNLPSGQMEVALTDLAGVFGDSMTAGDVGVRMTCTEADAIVRALRAGGHRVTASRWLAGHAGGDEDPEADRHLGDGFDLDAYLGRPRPATRNHRQRPTRGGAIARARWPDRPCAPPDLDQWAPVLRELAGSAVVDDAAWPCLAEAIYRAHAAGWDVREGVPRLIAQQEMPDRRAARELHYRLMIDCPAAMPTPPAQVDEHSTPSTPRAATPSTAGRSPWVPDPGQSPPRR